MQVELHHLAKFFQKACWCLAPYTEREGINFGLMSTVFFQSQLSVLTVLMYSICLGSRACLLQILDGCKVVLSMGPKVLSDLQVRDVSVPVALQSTELYTILVTASAPVTVVLSDHWLALQGKEAWGAARQQPSQGAWVAWGYYLAGGC